MFSVHNKPDEFKTAISDLCLRKTRSGKSHYYQTAQCFPSTLKQLEERSRGGLVCIVGLNKKIEIKLRCQISQA